MIDPNNDADLLTLEFAEAARNVANGVCVICDEALDPTAPKWASYYNGRHETAEQVAASIGPISAEYPDRHERCTRDLWD